MHAHSGSSGLAGVTDREILAPVFEFDSDNDIQAHRDKLIHALSLMVSWHKGRLVRDNTHVIDTCLPMGQYKLEKLLSWSEHGFYYIYTCMHVGIWYW